MSNSRPTLLVFTLGAMAEQRRRPLLTADHAALEVELRRVCLDRLLQAGREIGCRTVVASTEPIPGVRGVRFQGHGDFAARLRRVVAPIETSALNPLVLVGTDIPDLGAPQIRSAIDSLQGEQNRVVVGPSPDGGLYLLAASRPIEDVLGEVPWQRPDTRRRLLAAFRARGFEIVELEPLRDLDAPRDLEIWLSGKSTVGGLEDIRRRLRRALALDRQGLAYTPPPALLPFWVECQAGRAPPA